MVLALSSSLLDKRDKKYGQASRFRSLGLLCWGGCLKRLQLPWPSKSSSTIIIEPDPEPELSAYEELESGLLNISDGEDDFFDARSEMSENDRLASKSSKVSRQSSRLEKAASKTTSGSALSPETIEASQRLESLLSIKKLCHSGKTSGSATSKDCKSMDVEVETLLQVAGAQMWLCHVKDGIDIGCSTVLVEGVTVTEVVEALHNPEERLRWDGGNFRTFEVVSAVNGPVQQDIVYCVMPAPGMLTDRDVLQDRWKVSLDDGGQAILLQSRLDNSLRPETSQRIRAFTHVSGYLICVTSDGSVEITAVSQTNLGGSIPAWVQSQGRRLAKSKLLPWARKLESHCQAVRQRKD